MPLMMQYFIVLKLLRL